MHSCDSGCTSKRCMKIRFAAALKDDDRRRDFSHVDFLSSFKKPKMPTTADVARRYANHVESVEPSKKVGIKAKVLDFSFPVYDDDASSSDEDASSSDDSDRSSESSDADDADATTTPAEDTSNTESERFTGKETQRTKALQYFLQDVLDPNLEEMATISRSRPFCGMPGCGEPCDLQCLDCIGYYCEKHHIDLNQTHSTRVWNDELFFAKKTVLLPGFQDTSFVAKINSTPSFCRCDDPDPRPHKLLLLRGDLRLQETDYLLCRCKSLTALLHKDEYLQITETFAVAFRILDTIRRADSETLNTWVKIIQDSNIGRDVSIDHFRLQLAKVAYCQYLKRLKQKRDCPMCASPETGKLFVQGLGLDFSNVLCASHTTKRDVPGTQHDIVVDRKDTVEIRKIVADAADKCGSTSLPDGEPHDPNEKKCTDKFDGDVDMPALEDFDDSDLGPVRKILLSVCNHVWIIEIMLCYSKGERKQQLIVAIEKLLQKRNISIRRFLMDDPCHALQLGSPFSPLV